jgi:ubiquinone biosynthesis accessory factor UbiJ
MSLPLTMPLEILLTAGLEHALNQILALDERAAFRRQPLQGKVLQLDVRELKPLWLVFSSSQIDILNRYDGVADAGISLNLSALPRLRDKNQLTPLIREGKVDLQGDPALFNLFSILLGELQIDWEGQLARHTGDVLAHTLCRSARALHQGMSHQLGLLRQDVAEYVTEEARLAPGSLEVACFCEDVLALKRQFDTTALRLEKLRHRIGL